MMSMQDMFYGAAEPVWIVMPEKDDIKIADKQYASGSNYKEAEIADYSVLSSIPYEPYYYYPDNVPSLPPPPKKEESRAAEKRETKVVMKVPICCEECEESVEAALYRMKGVKSVECDIRRETVTVIAATATPADILRECRKVFRKSRIIMEQ